MKNKIQFSLSFLFFFVLSYYSSSSYENTLLWRISGRGLEKPSYLFGTIHLRNHQVFNFSDSVLIAFDSCKAYAMEILPDSLFRAMFEFEGAEQEIDLKQKLSKKFISKIDKVLKEKHNINFEDVRHSSPWFIKYLLESPEFCSGDDEDKKTIVDLYLYDFAVKNGKNTIGLENISEHLNPLTFKNQLKLLTEVVDEQEGKSSIDTLIKYYINEDLNSIDRNLKANLDSNPEFYYDFIITRNIKMADRIKSIIYDNSTFIAVGAAHLPGDSGLINLLRYEGFTVEPVKCIKTGLAEKYKPMGKKEFSEKYVNKNSGFSVVFPGKSFSLKDIFEYGNEIQGYFDYGNLSFYIASRISCPNTDSMTLDKILVRLKEQILFKVGHISNEKETTIKGLLAYSFSMSFGIYKYNYLYIKRDNIVYMLLTGIYKNMSAPDKLTNNFFNSFDTTDIEYSDWKNYSFKKYGFSVDFPDEPMENNMTSDEVITSTITADDKKTGGIYIVQVFTNKNDAVYSTDSLLFTTYREELNPLNKIATLNKIEDGIFEGANYWKFFYKTNHNTYLITFIFNRSSRFYTIITESKISDSSNISRFFNSFKLIDFDSTALYPARLDGLTALIPSKDFLLDTTDNYSKINYPKKTEFYSCLDSNSNITYVFEINQYSDFFQTKKDSNFLKKLMLEYSESDTIVYFKKYESEDYIGGEALVSSQETANLERLAIYLKGNTLYKVYCHFAKKDINNITIENVFKSLKIEKGDIKGNLFSDKLHLILNSIHTSDTSRKEELKYALNNYKFKKSHIDTIKKFLLYKYSDDTLTYNSTKIILLNKLSDLKDTSAFDFIRNHLSEINTSDAFQPELLEFLSKIKTKESYDLFFNILKNNLPQNDNYSYFYPFYYLNDSIDLTANYLFEILPLIDNKALTFWAIGIINSLLDSSKIELGKIKYLENKLLIEAKNELDSVNTRAMDSFREVMENINDENYSDEEEYSEDESEKDIIDSTNFYNYRFTYHLEFIINTLGYIAEKPSTYEFMESLLFDSSITLAQSATIAMLRNEKEVPKSIINRIASNLEVRKNFYKELSHINKLKLFPEEYSNQLNIAESDLYYNLLFEDEEEPIIEFITEKTSLVDSLNMKFFIFKFMSYYDSIGYFAVAGPYPLDKESKIIVNADMTGTYYDIYDESKLEDLLTSYIKTFKENKFESEENVEEDE